jgi:Cd2+/Zn2+-exporting ATPase
LAKQARRVIWQNLTFAFSVIAILVVMTILGNVELTLGVIGHEGSTLLVVANGLRLLLPTRQG